jgi:pentose-5-phosphate-3-epimerase
MPEALIAPSLLSGDFARLADECQRMLEYGADQLHMGRMLPFLLLAPWSIGRNSSCLVL